MAFAVLSRVVSIRALAIVAATVLVVGCNPIEGTGSGTPPPPSSLVHYDVATKTAVVSLVAGTPVGDTQFNFDGYAQGTLTITLPIDWYVTFQCFNKGTVPHSCALVEPNSTTPANRAWTTAGGTHGLRPGEAGSFVLLPTRPAMYWIASTVTGDEASGMWDLVLVAPGRRPYVMRSP